MKVKELKQLLESFDEDLEVQTYDGYWDEHFPIDEVKIRTNYDGYVFVEIN